MSASPKKDTRRECDRKNTALPRPCVICSTVFQPNRHHKDAKYCSKVCVAVGTNAAERFRAVAESNRIANADKQRGRGEGKTYRKYLGRHEHRVVAEKMLGRPLAKGEIVHHRDEDKLNNDPMNLRVMTQAEHMREHGLGIPGVAPAHKPWLARHASKETGNV